MFFWADSIVLTIQYGGRTELCQQNRREVRYWNPKCSGWKRKELLSLRIWFLLFKKWNFDLRNSKSSKALVLSVLHGVWLVPNLLSKTSHEVLLAHPRFFPRVLFRLLRTWHLAQRLKKKHRVWSSRSQEQQDTVFKRSWRYNFIDVDPWKWASLQSTDSPDLIARVADCENCAHCVDLNTPDPSDSQSLKKIRDEQYLTLQEWIDDYWRETTKEVFESILKS